MKKGLIFFGLFIILFSGSVFSQQYCIPGRFDTTYYFTPMQIDTLGGIVYGQNTDWLGNTVSLKFIISYPNSSYDHLRKRPFVLLMHGGGFYTGDKYELQAVMIDLAMRGYVCASIDYRTGWNLGGIPSSCNGDGYTLQKAIYRAMQDSKAAFRYFRANASMYRIDTNYFFTGGLSAGAVTSLMISYATQTDVNSFNPTLAEQLGLLDTATNSYRNTFKIKGIISASGGLLDTAFVKNTNALPTLMFHGTSDVVVPFGTGYAYSCTNYVRTEGSDELRKRFRTLSKPFELDYVPGGGHEGYYPIEFIQLRTVKFLKRVLCNQQRQIIIQNYTTILDTLLGTVTPVYNEEEGTAGKFELYQNYPNPFNPITNIRFRIIEKEFVTLKVYNILGAETVTLVNKQLSPGTYSIKFNASELPSGIYFYKITANEFEVTKKMFLLK